MSYKKVPYINTELLNGLNLQSQIDVYKNERYLGL